MQGSLLDHLGRPIKHFRWDRDAELLGRLEIEDQLELLRLVYGQVSRFGSLQNLVHVSSSTPPRVRADHPVGHEPTCTHKYTARTPSPQLSWSGSS